MGHLELCEFLLEQSPYLRDETMKLSALKNFASGSSMVNSSFESARRLADDMYDLFLGRFGLVAPVTDEEHDKIMSTENAESNMLFNRTLSTKSSGWSVHVHPRPSFRVQFFSCNEVDRLAGRCLDQFLATMQRIRTSHSTGLPGKNSSTLGSQTFRVLDVDQVNSGRMPL